MRCHMLHDLAEMSPCEDWQYGTQQHAQNVRIGSKAHSSMPRLSLGVQYAYDMAELVGHAHAVVEPRQVLRLLQYRHIRLPPASTALTH